MTTIFVRHQVADFDTWKRGFDEHGSVRREHGLTDRGLYRTTDDPDDVTIVLTADDVSRAQEFLASDDLKTKMREVGVVGAPTIWVADEA